MAAPRFLDAFCTLGRHLRMKPGQPETPEQLLRAMDHFGIHEALVVDTLCNSTDPIAGNERILGRVREHPRLHPAWAGLCTHSREMPPPADLVAQMKERGVGALFLFYGQFDIRLEPWGVDDLLGELERAGAPVFLCPTSQRKPGAVDVTDWSNVVRLCNAFPRLPVVVAEERIYGGQRAMSEALAACENLRVDMAALWLHRRVEFICREFGAHRLLWSSRLPERTPAASLAQPNYSDITPEELALIAGGNLRGLLAWNAGVAPAPEVTFPPPVDSLHAVARNREPLRGQGFHDCHGHLGTCSNRHVIHDRPEDVVAEMDRLGVEVACAFSFAGAMGDEVHGNDVAAEFIQRFPGRFVGFTLINPHRGEEMMLQELRRGLDRGMQGIKLATAFQGYADEGPLVDVAARFAHEHRHFILNHTWGGADQMRRLCTTYPEAVFITGHSTPAFTQVARDCPNLFICTCPFLGYGQTEEYVGLYGADRLLFGSDLMDLPIAWGLGPILYARIPQDDKRKILGGNLRRLMARLGIRPSGVSGS